MLAPASAVSVIFLPEATSTVTPCCSLGDLWVTCGRAVQAQLGQHTRSEDEEQEP